MIEEETNSNWSSGLTIWDRLHGTLRLGVPQDDILSGVPAYRKPNEVALDKLLSMPFVTQRPTVAVRVDSQQDEEPERWVQSACVLCSNGCGLDIGVKTDGSSE